MRVGSCVATKKVRRGIKTKTITESQTEVLQIEESSRAIGTNVLRLGSVFACPNIVFER
jgi:hypothetical protein